jgi:hypothetical protein
MLNALEFALVVVIVLLMVLHYLEVSLKTAAWANWYRPRPGNGSPTLPPTARTDTPSAPAKC